MKVKLTISFFIFAFVITLMPLSAQAKSRATVKRQSIRDENPKIGKEWLALPYVFSTDDLGTVFGVGGGAKGYFQDQLILGGRFSAARMIPTAVCWVPGIFGFQ